MAEEFNWETVLRERGMLEEPHDESVEDVAQAVPDSPAVMVLSEPVEPEAPSVTWEATPAEEVPELVSAEVEVVESEVSLVFFGPPEFCGPLPAVEIQEPVAAPDVFGPVEFCGPLPLEIEAASIPFEVESETMVLEQPPTEPEPIVPEVVAEIEPEAEPESEPVVLEVQSFEPEPVVALEVPAPVEPASGPTRREPVRLFSDRQEQQVLSQLVTPAQMKQAKARQKETKETLASILVSLRFTTEKRLLQAYAHQLGVSPWHIETDPPTAESLTFLPYDLCVQHAALPVAKRGDLLLVAMANPGDVAAIDAVRNASHLRIEPVLADEARLLAAIEKAYNNLESREAKDVDTLVEQALNDFATTERTAAKPERAVLTEAETRPVIGLVNQIVSDAIRMQASDIHLEPRYDRMEIRYRLDGQLLKVRQIPAELMPMLVTRVKIMAEVDIVEHRMPQDGRITAQLENGNTVDLRVSVLPNVHGPRIVLRILDKSVGLKRLDRLGFDSENLAMFRALVGKPYGLFLVTGPTGSGKTTTLYAALNEVKHDGNNIMTCEDPVEYDLEGINQSQVNDKVGLTFAQQLRAILRQDPDVVLVGEIRDQETAQTAIRAALTGHMVLSTLHCNDAPSAIPRLLDMGIDPYLLSTSLIGTMGQRLLRTLCPHCKDQVEPRAEDLDILRNQFGASEVDTLWQAVGCDRCYGTGYLGRMAVHEVLPVTEEVGRLVAARASVEELREAAGYYGYQTMQQDALNRVLAGQTTLSEAKRLLFFDTIPRRENPRSSHLRAA